MNRFSDLNLRGVACVASSVVLAFSVAGVVTANSTEKDKKANVTANAKHQSGTPGSTPVGWSKNFGRLKASANTPGAGPKVAMAKTDGNESSSKCGSGANASTDTSPECPGQKKPIHTRVANVGGSNSLTIVEDAKGTTLAQTTHGGGSVGAGCAAAVNTNGQGTLVTAKTGGGGVPSCLTVKYSGGKYVPAHCRKGMATPATPTNPFPPTGNKVSSTTTFFPRTRPDGSEVKPAPGRMFMLSLHHRGKDVQKTVTIRPGETWAKAFHRGWNDLANELTACGFPGVISSLSIDGDSVTVSGRAPLGTDASGFGPSDPQDDEDLDDVVVEFE